MRRFLAILAACGIALGLTVGLTGQASAAGETLACRIAPAPMTTPFTSPTCGPHMAASSYSVAFVVQNETSPFTAAWSVPAGLTIAGGCTSNATGCTLQVSSVHDQFITVSVTLTENGTQERLPPRRSSRRSAAPCSADRRPAPNRGRSRG